MSNTSWMTPFRQDTDYDKRVVFAKAMNVSEKTVQRWEKDDSYGDKIPFAGIAGLLSVEESALRRAHGEYWKQQRLEKLCSLKTDAQAGEGAVQSSD